jgi:hypothetical protein
VAEVTVKRLMLRVLTHCLSDGTNVSMLVEDMSRKNVSRFEYHMFYNLYSFVTYYPVTGPVAAIAVLICN